MTRSNPSPASAPSPATTKRGFATQRRVLPGFALTLGYTLFCVSLVVLLPTVVLLWKTATYPIDALWSAVSSPRALASYRLTVGAALAAASVNAIMGSLVAWCLVRYSFPGKRLVDSLVDLPFALPTAISGIALTAVYAPTGWLGRYLEPLGVPVAFTPLGITLALLFVGLPFVVRAVQPAVSDLDPAMEEAAVILGASRAQTLFRVLLPQLLPAMFTGFTMAFARGLGEYGSVIFIAGNMPMKTEITSLLIITRLEQFDYAGATAIGAAMLLASLGLLLSMNALQWWWTARGGRV
ncbi:MAG: sulfate ABC transporter permease subunit CysT [Bryobacterales bacterium]|nr:sulfate ABC transporter permease subunit CysT [Bryobacterales bacterium]